MPNTHARLSASAAERWMHCPASVSWCEAAGAVDKTSEFAEEGTEAHALAEYELKTIYMPEEINTILNLEHRSPEMDQAVAIYTALIQAIYNREKEAGGATIMVEQTVSLEPYIPEGFGTADAVIIGAGSGTCHVCDFKYGKGVKVDAKNNPQLRCYALGVVKALMGLYDFDTVVTHIIQPRMDNICEETLAVGELLQWGMDVLKPAAEKAWAGSDEAHSGEWCRFCPLGGRCRVRKDETLAPIEKLAGKDPAVMTPEEIGTALTAARDLSVWLDAVQAYALEEALDGKNVTGWKAVEGRAYRRYTDENAAARRLEDAGYTREAIFDIKLKSVASLEKAIGKKEFNALVGEWVNKPQGKPTLAPADDKRQAIRREDING